jgi:hypothetical protein
MDCIVSDASEIKLHPNNQPHGIASQKKAIFKTLLDWRSYYLQNFWWYRISGFHISSYESCHFCTRINIWTNISPPTSGSKINRARNQHGSSHLSSA